MLTRQRAILDALGIDLWVPKAALCQKKQPASLWRDSFDFTSEKITVEPIVIKKQIPQPVIIEEKKPQPVASIEVATPQIVKPFSLQALLCHHVVLLVDATHLTELEQRLWHNIQTSLQATLIPLTWSTDFLGEPNLALVQSYIQGFLDALTDNKMLITLGQLPYIKQSHLVAVPSLQQMLAQPTLKKQLWQLMQKIT